MHHCISRIKWQYLGTLVASVGIFFQINWRKSEESINPLPIEMGTFDFWLWCKLITPVEMVTERGSSLESSKDFKSIYSLFKFFFFFWILSTKWNVFFHFYRICGWPCWLTWKHLIQNGLNPGRTDTRLTCWKWLQLCWRSKSNMLIVLGLRWWWWPLERLPQNSRCQLVIVYSWGGISLRSIVTRVMAVKICRIGYTVTVIRSRSLSLRSRQIYWISGLLPLRRHGDDLWKNHYL